MRWNASIPNVTNFKVKTLSGSTSQNGSDKLKTMSGKKSNVNPFGSLKTQSFADFKSDAANWITLASGEYYPDILKDEIGRAHV